MPRRSLENFLSLHQHLCKYLHKLHFDLFIFSGVLLNGTSNDNQIELSMEQESFQDFKSNLIYIPKCSSQMIPQKQLLTKMSENVFKILVFFSSGSTKISDFSEFLILEYTKNNSCHRNAQFFLIFF